VIWRWPALLAVAVSACAARPPVIEKARAATREASMSEGDLKLKCSPLDAEVIVDGVTQGLCSDFAAPTATLTVGKGMHHIEVKKPGYLPYQTYFEPDGVRASVKVELKPAGTSPSDGSNP
jgi:hypothetical protein